MKYKHLFFLLVVGFNCAQCIVAQKSRIHNLDSVVVIADKRFKKNSISYKVLSIQDSTITNNIESFSYMLRLNTALYLRESGYGGISTVNFRGTGSSNTAVTWNGININSVNNGQTDFNSYAVGLYDNIYVRSGGGSTEFGSGAIGGTISLENALFFSNQKKITNQIISDFGSFTTVNFLYKFQYKSSRFSMDFGVSKNMSKNDFPIKGTDFKNSNGNYLNYEGQLSMGYKFSNHFNVKYYNVYSFADRFLSGELPNPTTANDKYEDLLKRDLVKITYQKNKVQVESKLAYLHQKFTFFDDKNGDPLSFGISTRYFGDIHLDYSIFTGATLSGRVKYESIFVETNQIARKEITAVSQSLIFNHFVNRLLSYNIKVRKDYNSDFEVPFTFASGFKFMPLQNFFVRANISKNFRVPTFNDLFWPNQGNLNLIPETSLQGEIGLGYQNKKFLVDVAYFNINLKNRITWLPGGDSSRPSIWVPVNLEETKNTGLEVLSKFVSDFFDNPLTINLNYTHTNAKNKATNKFLPFVPKQIINTSISYSLKKVSFFLQGAYNSSIFTTQSNSTEFTNNAFYVINLGGNYHINLKNKDSLKLGMKINNVLNHNYNIVQNRPMPGINYHLNINYKF